MKNAQSHVECNPREREPARPIVSAEHENSRNNRRNFHERNPHNVIFKRMLDFVLAEVNGEAKHSGDDVNHAYDYDCEALFHGAYRLYAIFRPPVKHIHWMALIGSDKLRTHAKNFFHVLPAKDLLPVTRVNQLPVLYQHHRARIPRDGIQVMRGEGDGLSILRQGTA